MSSDARILLAHNGVVRCFLRISFQTERDGSLYVIMDRSGVPAGAVSYEPGCEETIVTRPADRRGFRLSYHTTGRINYHGLSKTSAIFNEPLYAISQTPVLITISVPSVDRLDAFQGDVGSDAVINVPNGERLTVALVIAPWNLDIAGVRPLAALVYPEWFSLLLLPAPLPHGFVPEALREHFHYFTPRSGAFDNQTVSKDDALLHFHQKLQCTREMIIYSPNGEGVYRIVFAVPMRIPPKACIEFHDPDLTVVEQARTTTSLRFKLKDRHGNFVKELRGIKRIELDAEL